MEIKLLQLNCQGSYAVWDDLAGEIGRREVDVVAVQEPPGIRAGKVSRLPGMIPVMPAGENSRVGVHVRMDLTVQRLETPPCDWCVFAIVRVGEKDFVIGSAYLAPSEGISATLDYLGDVTRYFRANSLLVCMDVNVKSGSWHSRRTDARGRAAEEFFVRADLHVLNRPGPLATYCNVMGRGDNIDVMVCNHGAMDSRMESGRLVDHRYRAIGVVRLG